MIVATILMNSIVKDSNVKMVHSNAIRDIASLPISVVMVIEIVAICLTKLIVLHASREVDTVQNQGSNVKITCVFHHRIYAVSNTVETFK